MHSCTILNLSWVTAEEQPHANFLGTLILRGIPVYLPVAAPMVAGMHVCSREAAPHVLRPLSQEFLVRASPVYVT